MFMESLCQSALGQGVCKFIVDSYPAILTFDLLRYLAGAGGVFLVINILLAQVLARRKIRDQSPTLSQMVREFIASMRTVFIFSLTGLVIAGGAQAGWIPVYADPGAYGWVYFWVNVLGLIIAHDAWFYWTHRLMHKVKSLRQFHMLHHRSVNPSPWASYSFDATEAFANALFFPLILFAFPTSILAALIFTGHMMIRNALGHCGYEVFPAKADGRPMFDFLTSVTHHDLHHSHGGWNFGLYFTFWDRLMKTENPLYHASFSKAVGQVRVDAVNPAIK